MAVVHKTTMNPGKLELLAAWLPAQPWHVAAASKPELARAGGFRLDDPAGQVGIEFMAVANRASGSEARVWTSAGGASSPRPGIRPRSALQATSRA